VLCHAQRTRRKKPATLNCWHCHQQSWKMCIFMLMDILNTAIAIINLRQEQRVSDLLKGKSLSANKSDFSAFLFVK
jgi:hypothetical protein